MKRSPALSLILVFSTLVALVTLRNYGESWDELKLYGYASDSLEAYRMWFQHGAIPVTGDRFENYGPAFVMFTYIITETFARGVPGVLEVDVQHFVYFLTFLLGVWAFHQLAVRWMSRNTALGGAAAAVDRFELEYWGTSYREAAAEANRLAAPNANVWVDGPAHLFATFARPDFHLYYARETERLDHYDVVVTLARYNWEKTSFPEARIVYRVIREGAVFALIRIP